MDETLKTLRFVHLTLVGLVGALVILAQSDTADFAGAAHELDAMRSAVSDLNAYYNACNEEADRVLSSPPTVRDRLLALRPVAKARSVELADNFSAHHLGYCDAPPLKATLEEYDAWLTGPCPVKALGFTDVGLRRILEAVEQHNTGRPTRGRIVAIHLALGVRVSPFRPVPEQLAGIRKFRSIEEADAERPVSIFVDLSDKEQLRVQCDRDCSGKLWTGSALPIGVEWLTKVDSSLVQGSGGRATFFPKLKQFWPLVRPMTINEAYAHIDEASRGSEREVTILGLEINAGVARWAAPLLTALALCYLVGNLNHLIALARNKGDTLREFPWIALFPDRLSRVMTFLSLCILPVAANVFLLVRIRGPRTLPALAAGALVVCDGLLCAVVAVQLVRLRRLTAAPPPIAPD